MPTDHSAPYASTGNVGTVLGALSGRLPATINLEQHLAMAHADVIDRLTDTYGNPLPETWRPVALDAVKWAEAKLAAAAILDILRGARTDDSVVADKLRASAYATLAGGLPGQLPGDDGEVLTPPAAPVPVLPVTNGGPSNFADPYAVTEFTPAWWYA